MLKRSSGVLMHISSLWGDYSEGSLGHEAKEWIDFLADNGFRYWQVLPFCVPDEYNSPYKSFSTFSVNPFFIDLTSLYRQGLLTQEELEGARQTQPYICEFERLYTERVALLAKAAARYTNRAVVEDFLQCQPFVAQFCRFMALRMANQD
ncbi:MAG: 4-alpha-glucanotransferase, partial [Clostridia bacterium]|nr:4-alpha-glucanotransferase [Clostridia bacterium]